MSIETALVKLMSDNADVNAMVGSRIFPVFVPQGQNLPAITYQEISGVRDPHMKGTSGLVQARFQINGWTKTYSQARVLANYIRIALSPEDDSYPQTVDGTYISAIMLSNENDVPQIFSDNEELSGHGKMLDFTVWFNE
jgi:hypothetical protein